MDISSMTAGQVMVLYDDLVANDVDEIDIKLLDDKALTLKMDKVASM